MLDTSTLTGLDNVSGFYDSDTTFQGSKDSRTSKRDAGVDPSLAFGLCNYRGSAGGFGALPTRARRHEELG